MNCERLRAKFQKLFGPIEYQRWTQSNISKNSKGRRPMGETWLRVGAIIAEFNIGCYGVAC